MEIWEFEKKFESMQMLEIFKLIEITNWLKIFILNGSINATMNDSIVFYLLKIRIWHNLY